MNKDGTQYSYMDSGLNGFFSRRIGRPDAVTLNSLSNSLPRKEMDFDHMSTSGTLGDIISVNGIKLDGPNRRISIMDDLDIEVGRIGNLSD